MHKLKFAISTILITFFLLGITFAQKSKGNSKNFHKSKFEKLNLTEKQKEDFDKIRFSHEETTIDLTAKLKKNRLELKKMIGEKSIDGNELMKITEKGNNLRSELVTSKTKMWLEVYKILDDSQKEVWVKHFKMMGEKNNREKNKRFLEKRKEKR